MPDPAPEARPEHRSAGAAPPARPSRGARAERPGGGRRWLLAAIAVLGAFAGFLAVSTARLQSENRTLAGELDATRVQLQAARGELAAHRAHLAGARERAAGLATGLQELEAFLARDPTTPPAAE